MAAPPPFRRGPRPAPARTAPRRTGPRQPRTGTDRHTDRAAEQGVDQERADLLESLRAHRGFLRFTVRGLTDEQARRRTTASELTLGGLVKHVLRTERAWVDFVIEGPSAMQATPESWAAHADGFVLREDETLADVLAEYDEVARRTDDLVLGLPSLDVSHPLPEAPWFAPGATRSARRVLVHEVAETAQHAGHADILRESLDGQRTMG